jgi:hypothetical protein
MKEKYLGVDVAGICALIHNCTGCRDQSKRCCSSFEVTITGRELSNIVGYFPFAVQFCPHLGKDHSYENVFEQLGPDLYCIDTSEDGLCVFAYFESNTICCSLHTVSSRLKIPLREIKPMSCVLWPLAISEGEQPILSIDDDAFEFNCNAKNKKGSLSLCSSIAENIKMAFGKEFSFELQTAANKGLHWTRIPLRGPFASEP